MSESEDPLERALREALGEDAYHDATAVVAGPAVGRCKPASGRQILTRSKANMESVRACRKRPAAAESASSSHSTQLAKKRTPAGRIRGTTSALRKFVPTVPPSIVQRFENGVLVDRSDPMPLLPFIFELVMKCPDISTVEHDP